MSAPKHVEPRSDSRTNSGLRKITRKVSLDFAKFDRTRQQHTNNPPIDDQLVDKYMNPAALSHGIYIVYWTAPELRPSSWHRKHPDADVLGDELRVQARRHLPQRHIEVVVLDIGPAA